MAVKEQTRINGLTTAMDAVICCGLLIVHLEIQPPHVHNNSELSLLEQFCL